MNLKQKLEHAKTAVASITRHDDAPGEEVQATVDALAKFTAEEIAAAKARRLKAAKVTKK